MKTSNKAVALGLSLAMGLWLLSGTLVLAPMASAQTTSGSVQAQINALMTEIQTLQASLGTSSSGSSSSYNFTRNLTVGSTGADVGALQSILIKGGYLTVVSAPTNYFGQATKAALVAWQKAAGVSPASGFFGPLSRAALAASASNTGTGTGTGTGTNVVVPTGSGLSVTLASSNPAAGNVALGAVNVPMLALNFTAGSQSVTVNSFQVQRSGLSQDADLQNVYIYIGGTRVATDMSISSGVITFSNSTGLFTVQAGQTVQVTISADLYNGGTGSSSNAGHIMVLSVPAATSVVTAGSVAVSGSFPITGNQQTTVSVTNLATLTFTNSSSTTTVNAGQANSLVGTFSLQAGGDPVKVTSLNFTLTGSEPLQNVTNLTLLNGSSQVGAVVSSLNGNVATFNLSASPLMLAAGQTATLSLYATVTGGVGDYFQFTVQRSSDIQAIDNMYNVGIGAQLSGSTPSNFTVQGLSYISVAAGGLVISSASSTQLYAVANNSNTILGNFTVLASGDNIRLQSMTLTLNGTATATNVEVLINGTQLGTTQTTMATGAGAAQTFSNLNYIIPENTTQTLTVQGTVSAGSNIGASLSFSGQSQSNYATVTGSGTSPVLQVLGSSTNLTGYQNSAFGNPVLLAGTNAEVGSFILQTGQVNPAVVSGVTVTVASTSVATSGYLSNLYVTVNNTQIATAQGAVSSGGAYTFSAATPVTIPANSSVAVNVYATLSNSASVGSLTQLVTLTSVNATAANNAVSISAVAGQAVTVSQGTNLASITLDPSAPATTVMGMGTSANTLAAYRLNGSSTGPVTVTQLTVGDYQGSTAQTTNTTALGAFSNFTLTYNGSVLAAVPSLITSGTAGLWTTATGTATFVFATPVVIPQNGYATVDLVGNASTYNAATTSEASTHSFQAVQYGWQQTTGATTTIVTAGAAAGNNITLYRTQPSGISAAAISPVTTAAGVGNIDAAFAIGAGSGNDVYLQALNLTQVGSVVGSTTTLTFQLFDAANPSVNLLTGSTSTVTIVGANTTVVHFGSLNLTTSTASMTNSTGTVIVASLTGINVGDKIQIDSELMTVTGTSTLTLNVTRGATTTAGVATVAAAHLAGAVVTDYTTEAATGNAGWDIPASSIHNLEFKVSATAGTIAASGGNNTETYQVLVNGITWGDGTTGALTTVPSTITYPVGGQILSGLSD